MCLIALSLSLLQAAPPVPRQASEVSNDSSHCKNTKNASQNEAGTEHAAPAPLPTDSKTKRNTNEPAGDDKSPAVVNVFPVVSPIKDKWDFASILATIGIALVTLILACIAGVQARAARTTAQAVINSERARVVPELIPMARKYGTNWCRFVGDSPVEMSADEILNGDHLRHRLRFINMGRTAAQIYSYEIHCGLFDWEREILAIEQINYNGDFSGILPGSAATEMLDEIIDVDKIVKEPAAGVYTFKNWMVVLVSVTYQHIFSELPVKNEVFRFVFNPRKMRMERRAITEDDKKQAREQKISPPPQANPGAS
jgi:hypothetical protein